MQCLALHRYALQIQVRVVAAQVIGDGTGHAHGDAGLAVEFFQLDRASAFLIADHQLRHPHVGVGKLPEAQPARGLGQPRGDVDFAFAGCGFQLFKIGEIAPAQFDIEVFCEPLHQLDVHPGQALQATIVLRIGRLQHQADPQLALLRQPVLLFRGQLGNGRRRRGGRPTHQGKPQTADNPQAAKTHHRTLTH
ncbi:hypothetical protein D3C84_468020 [compost metagenome]